jgi:vacuolar-type H+-ATPase subunit D/Vma8
MRERFRREVEKMRKADLYETKWAASNAAYDLNEVRVRVRVKVRDVIGVKVITIYPNPNPNPNPYSKPKAIRGKAERKKKADDDITKRFGLGVDDIISCY